MPKLSCLFILAVIFGCSKETVDLPQSDNGLVSGATELIHDEASGFVFKVGETVPFTGKAVWRYSDGKPKQETTYEGGREHGEERWWHENGNRAGQCSYISGVLNGRSVQWFDEDSKKEMQVLYRRGKKDGVETIWYPNGQEKSIVRYDKGNRNGKAAGWYEEGSREWLAHWKDDQLHGESREWYRNSKLKFSKNYEMGKAVGKETHWFDSGEKSWEASWEGGKENGIRTEWYAGGKKMVETPYVGGMREGISTGWYGNGQKALEVQYVRGEAVGERHWDEKGGVIPPDPVPPGRLRAWKAGELEGFYPGKPEDSIFTAFGEPDEVKNGEWVIEGLVVGGKKTKARFTFKSGKVVSAQVDK